MTQLSGKRIEMGSDSQDKEVSNKMLPPVNTKLAISAIPVWCLSNLASLAYASLRFFKLSSVHAPLDSWI